MTDFERENFRKEYPNLFREINEGSESIEIDGVRSESELDEEELKETKESPSDPDIIDFLRLCSEHDEAMEIIDFKEDKGDITPEHAQELREQLENEGLRSFGSKRKVTDYQSELPKD